MISFRIPRMRALEAAALKAFKMIHLDLLEYKGGGWNGAVFLVRWTTGLGIRCSQPPLPIASPSESLPRFY